MFRSVPVFLTLLLLNLISRLLWKSELLWVERPVGDVWSRIRVLVFLNHTSLYEPIFLAIPPPRLLWRVARHGVIPAADKTVERPLVGLIFKFIAHQVVPVSRQRDETWFRMLQSIDPRSLVLIAPEGRMMRANGLDANGQPMTVRGGIADILEAVQEGEMLLAYSGGLHHVQVPGQLIPKVFKRIKVRCEIVDIASYVAEMKARGGAEEFKKNVRDDLDARRDRFAPKEPGTSGPLQPA